MKRGKRVTGTLRKAWLLALAAMLALLAAPAFALGLGQLTVKSQRGQPLLAEIAIISSDPSELENLQARLASPETFARVGLEPPTGAVTGLQFTVALDPRGNPVIRVTSREPVDESLLTFLLEVDWGQGRLVREYSALLDAPRTVSAPAQPPIEAPSVAPSNAIVREPEPAPPAISTQPEVQAKPETPAPATAQVAAQPAEAPPPSDAVAPTPAPAPAAAPERTAQPVAATPGEYGPVKVGDTLGKIARSVDPDGHSLDQVMLALLRANPDAFIKGNINLVKAGAVLRMPDASELSQYSASEARAIVHEQVGQWREMRQPAEQPVAAAATEASSPATAGASGEARVADARLEIVPPSGKDARRAGTRSGIQAGGEGDMVELQQTKETLAAREAEVQELKSRVAELEKLQHEQQQLIAMKDDKLAQAQQALAARQAATQAPATMPARDQAATWPWAIGGLVVVLALAWLFLRRRAEKPARPVFDTSRLAASVPARPQKAVPTPAPAPARQGAVAPTWHAGAPTPREAAPQARGPAAAPAEASRPGREAPAGEPASEPAPAGQDRIELARAYLDLGDVETARGLLQEVADSGDAAARGEASRLLRDLA